MEHYSCPICGSPILEEYDRVKIRNRWHEWTNFICANPDCDWREIHEPDIIP